MPGSRFNLNLSEDVSSVVREESTRTGSTMTEVVSRMIRFYNDTKLLRSPDAEIIVRDKKTGQETHIVLVST